VGKEIAYFVSNMKTLREQFVPIILTIFTFFVLTALLYGFVHVLNLLPTKDKIIPQFRIADILIGLTIYLKTSVDFAIFIGNLMKQNQGWKNRIAIEIGTALGNGLGTFLILIIWTFFKEVPLLMVIMIAIASLVLLGMAEDGLQELLENKPHMPRLAFSCIEQSYKILQTINKLFAPLIRRILPHSSTTSQVKKSFLLLLAFSFSVPFVLGLDDFAGYIPLFNIVNVVSFATGVFLGHMLLNVSLFASPKLTIKIVSQPIIVLLGSLAFIGIAVWGFVEVFHLIIVLF
jgi:hypothetical protein